MSCKKSLRLYLTMSSIHDEGTPELIYHLVQLAHWERAESEGATYYPPTYAADGFIHATHEVLTD
jgi:hypothetical protein